MKKIKIIATLILIVAILFMNINIAYATSIDDVFKDAKDFIKKGEENSPIDQTQLHDTSNFLYNLLLGIGIGVAAVVGVFIGIKYITGSIDEKADLKQALIGYAVSCVVIFGAFGIWKIVVTALQNM